ncbi:MAG TPA: glycoside hydrolase family 36 protein [Vicinamibacterales bacterium]|nr:glycoside hydrolase family 36 protein [Vicinamibacterales bacterium]
MRPRFGVLVFFTLVCHVPYAFGAAVVVAKTGDASIAHDSDAGLWSLTASGTVLTLELDPASDFRVHQLVTANNKPWISAVAADSIVVVNGQSRAVGNIRDGFTSDGVRTMISGTHLQLDAAFVDDADGLRVIRHYRVTSTVPAFEVWTTFESLGGPVSLSNLNALQMTIPNGTVRYVTGLMGDNADVDHESAFTRKSKALAAGEHFALRTTGRSSEQTVPSIFVDGSSEEFFAALLWSGAWSLSMDRSTDSIGMSLGVGAMTTTLVSSIDDAHVVYGVARGGVAQASATVRSFVIQGLRNGTALSPLVTYNTWFAYGTNIDETTMKNEMAHAAALGAELFVVDAGWYRGAGAAGPFDFDAGLGSWDPDPIRFPNGLHALTDYAHSVGMKFGIWVEPERVNLSVIGDPGPSESWLAMTGGNYGSDHAGQICLAGAEGRAWVMQRLTALIDSTQPDYLKWDNNMWINCDRAGHGHGATDGNFAHVTGLYQMLADLKAKYPSLLIENVSGGGNRLDLGMMRYTDVAWMDDRTAPSAHVRHNIEGLSQLFPPGYLLSFVTDHAGEPLHSASDMPLYVRSRAAGVLGLCFVSDSFDATDSAALRAQIASYKTLRSAIGRASGVLMGSQASDQKPPAWDVIQESPSGSSPQFVIWAFQSDTSVSKVNVKPSGLTATTTYEVRSVDQGVLGTSKGSDLSANGIDIFGSPATASHVIVITPKS